MTDTAAAPDEDIDADVDADEEGLGEGESKRLSGKKIVLFFVLPVVLVLLTAAGVYFSGLADGLLGKTEEDKIAAEKAKQQEMRATAVFFDLPELLVNLNSSGRRTNFLKISISLELPADTDTNQLQAMLPRVVDSFQVYLRELRVTDLKGSAGMYRLREDLLRRVNEAAAPIKVNDVLFKEMLIQ